MEKINYQLETDKYIEEMQSRGEREKLLLHACCAPCSSYVLEYLCRFFDITVYFSNPNITDEAEYEKRLAELYRLCSEAPFCSGVDVVRDPAGADAFFEAVRGLEGEPEGGSRCEKCFRLRLERSAQYAKSNGYGLFATTLTVSPHKNAQLINSIGFETAQKYGVNYLPSDFKKRGGYQRSIVLSREYGIYRQQYCGCVFSYISAEEQRKNSAAKKEGGEE